MNQPPLSLPPAGTKIHYALLHHTNIPNPHFDLLLQIPGTEKLPTWRITPVPPVPPPASPPLTILSQLLKDLPTSAERTFDHRPLYLTFEGPLSNNRGTVKRIAQGPATILLSNSTTCHVHLSGDLEVELSLPA